MGRPLAHLALAAGALACATAPDPHFAEGQRALAAGFEPR